MEGDDPGRNRILYGRGDEELHAISLEVRLWLISKLRR